MIKVPTTDSKVKVTVRYAQGPRMIPPQPDTHVFEGTVVPSYKWLNDRQFCITGDDAMKIRVIDIDMVKDIALLSGSMKDVDTGVKVYEVAGSKGKTYIVKCVDDVWSCTCPAFGFSGNSSCKHIKQIKDENGWK